MMDYNSQLKLQAYLDSELTEGEAREVTGWLAKDQEAVALLGELKATRQAMSGFETGIKLPESREFYWSKIERQIGQEQTVTEPVPAFSRVLAAWRRFLVPAAGVAAVVLVALGVLRTSSGPDAESWTSDSSALTYRDYRAGTTLVWLSYPAEEESGDGEAVADQN